MKPLVLLLLALPLAAAEAQASAELAREKLCLGCHALDRKLVGPAFRDVAARYAGQADAAARLADKVLNGSRGAWGPVPMPASAKVSAQQARQLAEWVLMQK